MASSEHLELSTYIRSIHTNLRQSSNKLGPETAWKQHCEQSSTLKKYAESMQKLATQHWEGNYKEGSKAISRIKWVFDNCMWYFKENERVRQRDREIEISKKIEIDVEIPESEIDYKLKLLDVGSCYNPFKQFDCFEVIAIDIAPANNDVRQCDFLNVELNSCERDECSLGENAKDISVENTLKNESVGNILKNDKVNVDETKTEISCMENVTKTELNVETILDPQKISVDSNYKLINIEGSKTLEDSQSDKMNVKNATQSKLNITNNYTSEDPNELINYLQPSSFDIIVFSLLLEYLPSPEQRYICCQKAYKLLKPEGILFIITPDSKHVGKNAKIMKTWRLLLANLGFSRIKYEKLPHIHCMIFRKSLKEEIAKRWADLYSDGCYYDEMVIPQDFNNKIESEPDTCQVNMEEMK